MAAPDPGAVRTAPGAERETIAVALYNHLRDTIHQGGLTWNERSEETKNTWRQAADVALRASGAVPGAEPQRPVEYGQAPGEYHGLRKPKEAPGAGEAEPKPERD